MQHPQMLLKKVDFFQICANNIQRIATCLYTSQQDGQTGGQLSCCDQHFYDMLRRKIVVVLPGLSTCNNVNSMYTLSLE